jgi:hypothetical protein
LASWMGMEKGIVWHAWAVKFIAITREREV